MTNDPTKPRGDDEPKATPSSPDEVPTSPETSDGTTSPETSDGTTSPVTSDGTTSPETSDEIRQDPSPPVAEAVEANRQEREDLDSDTLPDDEEDGPEVFMDDGTGETIEISEVEETFDTFAGFITVIGRTNVGKSTLINALVDEKVSIVTDKPQTTNLNIRGILTEGDRQAVFVDTPGLHRPRDEFSQIMLGEIPKALRDIDLVLIVVEPEDKYRGGTRRTLEYVSKVDVPRFLVINKVDLADPGTALSTAEVLGQHCEFDLVLPISALYSDNIDFLREKIMAALPSNPFFYPEDMVTDLHQVYYVAEVIREKAMLNTKKEVPHSIAVKVEKIEDREKEFYIEASIYVDRDSLKPILVGKRGQMIKKIGIEARKDLEEITGKKVVLMNTVKVMKNWKKSAAKAKTFRPDS